jgi:hypothetical protein
MRVFIGFDVSLAKTAICVVDHDGAVKWQGKVRDWTRCNGGMASCAKRSNAT